MADDEPKWGPSPYARPYVPSRVAGPLPKRKRQVPVVPGVTEEAEDKEPAPRTSRLADAYRWRRV